MLLALLLRLLSPLVRFTKTHRRTQFEALPLRDVDVLFLGDSITEGGMWDEWFPDLATANRGIAGDTSGEVVQRLDSLASSAKVALLLIGTNDLSLRIPEDEIVDNVTQIVTDLRARFPDARIIVQSVMPRKPTRRAGIASLNRRLSLIAVEVGADYLDLWPALAGSGDALLAELSLDHLHLNGEGYRRWVDQLRPVIRDALATPAGAQPS